MQATAPPQPNYRPQLYIMPENAGAAQEKKKKKTKICANSKLILETFESY